MMKKEKTLRMAVTGALLLTVVAAGISMYRTDTTPKKESKAQQEQAMQEEDSKDVTSKDAEAQDTGELAKNTTENQEATPSPTMNQDNPDNAIPPTQEGENTQETTESQESADTSAAVQPELNFTEDSQMLWPVNGQVVIDYSMDATTYFPTLDQYKYNDALMLGCESGEPVQAAANGQVVSISEDVETGTTMVMDLGNGYQATYGQLKVSLKFCFGQADFAVVLHPCFKSPNDDNGYDISDYRDYVRSCSLWFLFRGRMCIIENGK